MRRKLYVLLLSLGAWSAPAGWTQTLKGLDLDQAISSRALLEQLVIDDELTIQHLARIEERLPRLADEQPGSYPIRLALARAEALEAGLSDPVRRFERIVGGEVALPGEIPWQLALVLTGYPAAVGQFCGGSLVGSEWALTAAHCVERTPSHQFAVLGGVIDLADPQATRVDVAQVILHPSWDPRTLENDIALLRLATVMPEDGSVEVVELAATGTAPPGSLLRVSGWGTTVEGGNPSRLLRKVVVPVVRFQDCNSPGFYNGALLPGMLCAGIGGRDACQGDSGGPLVSLGTRTTQVGIVSWGVGCARPNRPGVYTDVSHYREWIEEVMAGSPAS